MDNTYVLGENPNESVLIMGTNKNYRVTFVDGRIEEGGLFVSDGALTASMVQPENGYIVMPIEIENDSNTHYGIHAYLKYGLVFQAWIPCEGEPIKAFKIPKGEIGYIGDFIFENRDGNLHYQINHEMEKLKKFLESNYPNIADKPIHTINIEEYRYNYKDSCTTEIIVYVPRYD